MNAADLVALCDAHGIDFVHVAGSSNNIKGIAGKRRHITVEIEPGITGESRSKQRMEAPDTANGKESRTPRAKTWSSVELGIAAYGVTALHWAATQHTIANDRRPDTLRVLMCGLRYQANKMATQNNWETVLPSRIVRDPKTGRRIPGRSRQSTFYVDPLCMLVLDEISFLPAFTAAPQLHAIYMGVEPNTWEDVLAPRFEQLQHRYAGWYGSGLRMIQRRISGDEAEEREVEAVA